VISRDEWLKALGDAVQPSDPDALTVKDLEREFGMNRHKALAKALELVKAGLAVQVTKMVHRSNGHPYRAPAFKLVNQEAACSPQKSRRTAR
jgi:hypothetical protein